MRKAFFAICAAMASLVSYAQIPDGAIIVAADGSGQFTSIQTAINSIRSFTPEPKTIYIKNGIYKEKVIVETWHTDITIIGESTEKTVLVWNDFNGNGKHTGNATALWSEAYSRLVDHDSPSHNGTFLTGTLIINGNDITVRNMTVENSAGKVGQALAISVEGDRVAFYNCRFLGNQDTVYLGREGSRNYFKNCYIEGTTDFIFGHSTALFEDCTIHCKSNSFITAASTPGRVEFGFVLKDCKITAAPGVERVYLGRPWRKGGATAFVHCELGGFIASEGWNNWGKGEDRSTARYIECDNYGPGAGTSGRVKWSQQVGKSQASRFTAKRIFDGIGGVWIP